MFDIHLDIGNISISSIEREDIVSIQHWINNQSYFSDNEKPLMLEDFYERFLEYYVGESEFFLKIKIEDKMMGVLKGRIEFKSYSEVWVGYYLLDSDYRGKGIGSTIINGIIEYFQVELGIFDFFATISEKDINILNFWKRNNFKLLRVSKDFFNIAGRKMDMLIFQLNR
jgi:RimJ/RimL family protein N-acetyltransferase